MRMKECCRKRAKQALESPHSAVSLLDEKKMWNAWRELAIVFYMVCVDCHVALGHPLHWPWRPISSLQEACSYGWSTRTREAGET